jgi:hypothetical protein
VLTGAVSLWTAGDEHVLPAVVGERLTGEAAVEGLQFETGDVDEPEPLVLGRPPQRNLWRRYRGLCKPTQERDAAAGEGRSED